LRRGSEGRGWQQLGAASPCLCNQVQEKYMWLRWCVCGDFVSVAWPHQGGQSVGMFLRSTLASESQFAGTPAALAPVGWGG
jgi:hypothetical protein